jgi:hypothetical protein
MASFDEDRKRIAGELAEASEQEARLLAEADLVATALTRVRARIASLRAEDQTYATASSPAATAGAAGDLAHMTIREAILTVLTEARPKPVRLRDLDRTLEQRGKKVQGGVSVDLTSLKQSGDVINPTWGYWTVP